jgi:hypothetical protein
MILLSIHIPTTDDRAASYALLEEEIRNQCVAIGEEPIESWPQFGLNPGGWRSKRIEFLYCCDNKEISIGKKRDILYQASTGLYSWQIDSDDWIAPIAIRKIVLALKESPDCVTFREKVTIDGVEKDSIFDLIFDDWAENEDGFDYVRTPFFKTPILTGLCQLIGVNDMRYGEDHDFARRIKPWLKTQVHISNELYYYQHTSTEFKQRYGIT